MQGKWIFLCAFFSLALAACAGTGREDIGLVGGAGADLMEKQRFELQTCLGQAGGVVIQKIDSTVYVTMPCDGLFEPGSENLSPAACRNIENVASVVNRHGGTQITVDAHTDCLRSEEENLELTEKQACAMKEALVTRGVAPARIRARGWGEAKPIATNATEDGRKSNRRVIITLAPAQTDLRPVK